MDEGCFLWTSPHNSLYVVLGKLLKIVKSYTLTLTHNSSSRSSVSPPIIFTLCIGNCQTLLINYQVQSACRANRIDVTVPETREMTCAAQAYIPAHEVNGLHITHLKLTFKSNAQKFNSTPFVLESSDPSSLTSL